MSWPRRLDIVVLALMLVRVVQIVMRGSYCYHSALANDIDDQAGYSIV